MSKSPLRSASVARNGVDSSFMSAASRYAHNLKVLRRRDPSILRIFDQFSHVCVYHHNGERWEKKGYEGSMFLYERADYPPYGFYILNRQGMDDYIQRLWPEDNVGVHGNILMLRTWPDWSRNRVSDIAAIDPFDRRYKWNGENPPSADKATSQTIGLWMFTTDSREPMIKVMNRLHDYVKQNLPYPEEFRYGPDKAPPPTNGIPLRTASAASTGSGVSAASSSHTGSLSASSSQPRSQRHSPNQSYLNPLLYQTTNSPSFTLEPVDETPRRAKRRKEKRGRPIESGDITPMANPANHVSDLEKLFSKLVKPSVLQSNSSPVPTEGTLTSGPSSQPSSNKVTIESLFASARISPSNETQNAARKSRTKPSRKIEPLDEFSGSVLLGSSKAQAGRGESLPATTSTNNTGLALLNDIFASASSSSIVMPERAAYPTSEPAAVDEPEAIEIHSPRPQAPVQLASMFDAAAVPSPSPAAVSGLGLGLEHVGTGRQRRPAIADFDEPIPLLDSLSAGQAISTATAESRPDEVRRKLLDMIGLGSKVQSYSHNHLEVSGDATPRVGPVAGLPRQVSNGGSEYSGLNDDDDDDDDDDDEAILELDFSDTHALSDLRVFERREQALREQLLERRTASRNASSRNVSRSTTPAVSDPNAVIASKANNVHGSSLKGFLPFAGKWTAAQPVGVDTDKAATMTSTSLGPARSITPIQPSRETTANVPVTPPAAVAVASPPAGSPSSTRKKTRRGRGRGKEGESKENLERSLSPTQRVKTSVVPNGDQVSDPASAANVSEALANGVPANPDIDRVVQCLSSVLSLQTIKVECKEDLTAVTLRLLQTDTRFVDELWNAWNARAISMTNQSSSDDAAVNSTFNSQQEQIALNRTASPSTPPLKLARSASAVLELPTLATAATSLQTFEYSQLNTDKSSVSIPPMVMDVESVEAARERKENQNKRVDVDVNMEEQLIEAGEVAAFDKEEENDVVESML
ncbi:hypothetical protein BDP27DRAFT_1449928 [Rhodocollybia butyracea]|uniref:Uncharacterized protein n=1 Tax=Rhodocollybia butyracea TaxID=206335 RepID=A0A9P5U5S7_9AGAR|nr:hypothetical protein BDP27DRAFT_1449928 [Rhodocollybia butyracea]